MDMTPQAWPDWYDGRHINEVLFCQQFLDKHPMKCVRGRLFTVDGLIEDEGQIGNLILEEISGVLTSGLSKVVTNLLASIKLQAYSPPLPIETDRIHVANGTYFMDGSFTADKSYCNNRLTVAYNPDAPTPKKVAAIPVRAAATGRHSHLAGVPWLLPAADYQGAKNAHAHRQGRRGQKPHWAGHALTAGRQHEYHQHPEGGEQPVQPRGFGKQAPDGGRRYGFERSAQDQLYQIHRDI